MSHHSNENFPCLHRWDYTAASDGEALVLPDGCVDILVSSCEKTGQNLIRATDWDFSPRQVRLMAGTSLTGYRLRPGTTVCLSDIQIDGSGFAGLDALIGQSVRYDPEVSEIIDALGLPDSNVERLARQQGVSERTLQRHFRNLSLPTPIFWRQLGRARRAVQGLSCDVALSEIALDYGYSDQAHMTREFRRWFGRSPEQLHRDPGIMSDLAQPGLGNWS